MTPKSVHACVGSAPLDAAQPIIGGSAPGIAPTTVPKDDRRFSGV